MVTAGTTYYLSCKNNRELFVSTEKLVERSLFKMQLKDEDTILPEIEKIIFAESSSIIELIAEIALSEE